MNNIDSKNDIHSVRENLELPNPNKSASRSIIERGAKMSMTNGFI